MKPCHLAVALAMGLLAADFAPASAQAVEPLRYVAMGSSFASGPGIVPQAGEPGSAACGRSGGNYAHLLAQRRNFALTDVTCGGATTANILVNGQFGSPRQLDAITPETRLVTVTIGGNDVLYIATMGGLACRKQPGNPEEKLRPYCTPPPPEKMEAGFASLEQRLRDIASGVHGRAPSARLIFIDYLSTLPQQGTCDNLALTSEEADRLRRIAGRVDAITARAAQAEHAGYLAASDLSRGHDACSQLPWTNGFKRPLANGKFDKVPFHPTAEGMAAIATALDTMLAQPPPLVAAATNPASIDARIASLLQRMTPEEKVAQLEGASSLPSFVPVPGVFEGAGIHNERAKAVLGNGIGTYAFVGDFAGEAGTPQESARKRNLLQKWILSNTRLGIPVLFHGEALHGGVFHGATTFPEVVGLGSTWDPALVHEMFTVVAQESRAIGNTLLLAPVLDLSRDPRYGRDEEMYSEDPFLVTTMGVAAITGLQGAGPDSAHVIATAKHFVHGQPENGTNVGPSDYSERTMRDVFLPPFEAAVRTAHVGAVLASYNETGGGIPAHADPWLLKDVLRKEFGFTGPVVSDYFAVRELQTRHHIVNDLSAAGLLAFRSGVDMELPEAGGFPALIGAVKDGSLPMADLDAAVTRVLRLKFEAGLFDHPYVDVDSIASTVGTAQHAALSRKVADESIVLLKNNSNTLPLDPRRIKTLAVIGPNADKQRIGGYSGATDNFTTVLAGIRRRAGAGVHVFYAEGCRITEPDINPQLNQIAPYQAPSAAHDDELIAAAVAVARSADAVLLVLGGNEVLARESFGDTGSALPISFGDSDSLDLPGRQMKLVRQISALNKPTVAVLINGKAYSVGELVARVPAVVEAWYPGQETGNAVADIVFGDVNPSGHLPVTIARNVGQLPVFYYQHPAARRGYVLDSNEPLFPFGFGLSYTHFAISKPVADRSTITTAGSATVSVTVTNTGRRDGDDVVQLYVHHEVSSVVQPVMLLKDFRRVTVPAGKSIQVSFVVDSNKLAILDRQMKRTVEPGTVRILVGDDVAHTAAVELSVEP